LAASARDAFDVQPAGAIEVFAEKRADLWGVPEHIGQPVGRVPGVAPGTPCASTAMRARMKDETLNLLLLREQPCEPTT
jgi:hypothetical protein